MAIKTVNHAQGIYQTQKGFICPQCSISDLYPCKSL